MLRALTDGERDMLAARCLAVAEAAERLAAALAGRSRGQQGGPDTASPLFLEPTEAEGSS